MLTGKIVYRLCTRNVDFQCADWEDITPELQAIYQATADWGNKLNILALDGPELCPTCDTDVDHCRCDWLFSDNA